MKKALEKTLMVWVWICVALGALVALVLVMGLVVVFLTQGSENAFGITDFPQLVPQLMHQTAFTIVPAVLGVALALPIALCLCIYICVLAPRRLATLIGGFAWGYSAIPAVVLGFFSMQYIMPYVPSPWLGMALTLMLMAIPRLSTDFIRLASQSEPIIEAAACLGAYPYQTVLRFILPGIRGGIVHFVLRAIARGMSEGVAVMIALMMVQPEYNTLATAMMRALGVTTGSVNMQAAILMALTLLICLGIVYSAAYASARR